MIQHYKTHLRHITFHNFKHAPNLSVCQLGRDFFETLKDTKYTLTSYTITLHTLPSLVLLCGFVLEAVRPKEEAGLSPLD